MKKRLFTSVLSALLFIVLSVFGLVGCGGKEEEEKKITLNVTAKELVVSKDVVGADGWLTVEVPLGQNAGKETKIEIVNQPNGWSWEAAYFAKIEIVEK